MVLILYQKELIVIYLVVFLGINIGPNKDTKDKEDDYYSCLSKLSEMAGYVTINISSPNTEGLRNFHDQKELEKTFDRY